MRQDVPLQDLVEAFIDPTMHSAEGRRIIAAVPVAQQQLFGLYAQKGLAELARACGPLDPQDMDAAARQRPWPLPQEDMLPEITAKQALVEP